MNTLKVTEVKAQYSPNERVAGGGVVESRGREVHALASAMDNERISFADKFLSGVVMHRRLNAESREQ